MFHEWHCDPDTVLDAKNPEINKSSPKSFPSIVLFVIREDKNIKMCQDTVPVVMKSFMIEIFFSHFDLSLKLKLLFVQLSLMFP